MSKLDLTDLRLLQSLGQTGTVSATANELGLSQPSVSIRLGKLRRHFKDPLFVRTSAGMVPTPRAASLTPAVQGALALFDGPAKAGSRTSTPPRPTGCSASA